MIFRLAAIPFLLGLCMPVKALAAEPGTPELPPSLLAIEGCWSGTGTIMEKPVTIRLAAHRILLGAMLLAEVESAAVTDPQDRYAAHLLFGAGEREGDAVGVPVSAFWADSFGGTFTATGSGTAGESGFLIDYRYPDSTFSNRWQINEAGVEWQIVAVDATGGEQEFAHYRLTSATCPDLAPDAVDS